MDKLDYCIFSVLVLFLSMIKKHSMRKLFFFFLLPFTLYKAQTPSLNRLTDICVGSCSGVRNIGSYNGIIYFSGQTPTNSVGLWKTDGTTAGTVLIKEVSPSFSSAANYIDEGPVTSNGLFFFGASTSGSIGYSLWRSDGTAAGTFTLTGTINPTSIIELNGFVVFMGEDAVSGNELWRSDGTVAGTYMIKDIYLGTNSGVSYLDYEGVLNNKLFFSANDGTHGKEMWVSDGTTTGTYMVKDLCVGTCDGYFQNPIVYNNQIHYSGYSNTLGSGIFKSSGVLNDPAKTLIMNWYSTPVILNSSLYFTAYNSSTGYEFYKSDGTNNSLVKDIYPGTSNSFPSFVTSINNKIYFKADDGTNGTEPWISDGTTAGTYMIKDINPGSATGCYTSSFRSANNKVYFIGQDPTYGREIWETDGTTAGTFGYDIKVGTTGADPFINRTYNNELYLVASDGITGTELWKIGGGLIGVRELEKSSDNIKVYPNPTTGNFIIDSETETSITITNILGKTILTQKLHSGKNEVILTNQNSGIYLIKNNNSTFKIIKQ